MKRSWVQDPDTGKLIPKEEWRGREHTSAYIQGDIEGFVSPVDGEHITTRSQLRAHHRRHGTTDSRDYSHEFLLDRSQKRIKEMTGQTPEAKRERIDLIRRELSKYGG